MLIGLRQGRKWTLWRVQPLRSEKLGSITKGKVGYEGTQSTPGIRASTSDRERERRDENLE
jgi:hypothetical protein